MVSFAFASPLLLDVVVTEDDRFFQDDFLRTMVVVFLVVLEGSLARPLCSLIGDCSLPPFVGIIGDGVVAMIHCGLVYSIFACIDAGYSDWKNFARICGRYARRV